jgi:uncharacterized protein
MISESVLKEATDRLVSRFHPEKIILCGSQARGDAHEHSDVNLLVVCECPDRRRPLILDMYRALKGMDFAKDIIVMTPKEFELGKYYVGTIADPASKEGRVLYER